MPGALLGGGCTAKSALWTSFLGNPLVAMVTWRDPISLDVATGQGIDGDTVSGCR